MPTQNNFTWLISIQREQAERIPRNTWDKYREVIQEKYDRLILTDLIDEMEAEYGFIATNSQYNHQFKRWGFTKRPRKRASGKPRISISRSTENHDSPKASPFTTKFFDRSTSSASTHHGSRKRLKTRLSSLSLTWNTSSTRASSISRESESSGQSAFSTANALRALQEATSSVWRNLPNIMPSFNDAMDFDLMNCGVDQATMSLTDDIKHSQERADVSFYLGLYDRANELYRQILRQLQTSMSSEQDILLAITACLRSATDASTLLEIVNTHEPLQKLYQHIESEIVSRGDLQLYVYDMPGLLRILIILDVRKRLLSQTANNVSIYIGNASLAADLRSGLPSSEYRHCHYMVWLYIKQMLSHGVCIKEMFYGVESRQLIVGDHPILYFLKRNVGNQLIYNCLEWCEGASRARVAEACIYGEGSPESTHSRYERHQAAMFCFLWKGWKRQSFDSKAAIFNSLGIPPSLFLMAVVYAVTEERFYWTSGGLGKLHSSANTFAIDTLKGYPTNTLSTLVVGKMQSAWLNTSPYPNVDEKILSVLFQYSWKPMLDCDMTTNSSTPDQDSHTPTADLNGLDPSIHEHCIDINGYAESTIDEEEEEEEEEGGEGGEEWNEQACDDDNDNDDEESAMEIDSEGVRAQDLTATPPVTGSADWEMSIDSQHAATNISRNEKRNTTSLEPRESWNSWTKSLRSSDGSYKGILAIKKRIERSSKLELPRTSQTSHTSQTSRTSFKSLLRQVTEQHDPDLERLSAEFDLASITSDQRSERLSKNSFSKSRNALAKTDPAQDNSDTPAGIRQLEISWPVLISTTYADSDCLFHLR